MRSLDTQLSAGPRRVLGPDLYAASLSILCLLHCLALPLVASFLPLFGYLSENELVHRILVLLAAPATLWVVWQSLPTATRSWPFLVMGAAGLMLLLLGAFAESLVAHERTLTVIGALILGAAHLWRWLQMFYFDDASTPAEAGGSKRSWVRPS